MVFNFAQVIQARASSLLLQALLPGTKANHYRAVTRYYSFGIAFGVEQEGALS